MNLLQRIIARAFMINREPVAVTSLAPAPMPIARKALPKQAFVFDEDVPEWTDDERQWLRAALVHPNGKHLRTILYQRAQGNAFAYRERTAFQQGTTTGQLEMIGIIESLAEVLDEKSTA